MRLLLLACVACTSTPASTTAQERPPVRQPDKHESNVTKADYVGPRACGECHPDQLAQWSQSLHRVMNAKVGDAGAVIGNFAGARLAYKGGEVVFGPGRTMTLRKGDRVVRYAVTRTIGRRGLQEYVGRESPGADEVRLPFGWWPRAGGWVPQPAFDPWLDEASFDPFTPVREPWAERCPWCHSTYPFARRIARAAGPRGLGHGLEQYFAGEPGSERLAVDEQVTTGISCESCHLGGRAHASGQPIHFVPQVPARAGVAAWPTTFADERRDARVVNAVCAQCHSGPSPRLADGTALRNSSEALDLAASSCTGIRCIDCHDPHRADSRQDEARAIAACTHCHATQADPAHAGRGHATTTCLDCHMPRIVMGIDRYVRTHRISSPNHPTNDAPNACNLCHLDRSLAWTTDELRAGWDLKLPRRGGDESLGEVWLASKSPAIRLIAAHAYARSPLGRYELATIERGLTDKLAYVRAWMQFAITDIKRRSR